LAAIIVKNQGVYFAFRTSVQNVKNIIATSAETFAAVDAI